MTEAGRPPWGLFAFAGLCALVLCGGIALTLPIGEGGDELGYLACAGYLFETGKAPSAATIAAPQAAQHPFLYYAFLAAIRFMTEPVVRERPGAFLDLPYERRVRIDRGPVADPMSGLRIPDHAPARTVSGLAPYVWRASGIVLFAVLIVVVLRAAWLTAPGATVALAAATTVLGPQLASVFASPTSDQLAILFSSLGCAAIVVGLSRGGLRARTLLAAGSFFALGMLSKSNAVSGLIASAILTFFWADRPVGQRLRDLVLLGAPTALGAGWWYAARIIEGGYAGSFLMGGDAGGYLRFDSPDWFAYLETLGVLLRSWVCSVGHRTVSPGDLLVTAGAAVPILTLGGAALALCARARPRRERALAGSFLAAVVLVVVLFLSSARYATFHAGRHLLPLIVPGVLAADVAFRHLFGGQAPKVLAAGVTLTGVMGIVLLHGQLIPRYHPPHDRFGSPDLVAYVDAGAPWADPFVEKGAAAWARRPEESVVFDAAEVRLRVTGLEADGAYVAWLRLHPLARVSAPEEFFADGLPLGGMVTPLAKAGWYGFTVPRSATLDGVVSISARAAGGAAVIAELLVTRVPVRVDPSVTLTGEQLRVRLTSPAPERLPRLQARVAAGGRAASDFVDVAFAAGKCDLVIPLAGGASGPLDLELWPPAGVWSDVKLLDASVPPAERTVHKDSPGFDVVRIPKGAAAGAVIARLPVVPSPGGRFRFELADESGATIGRGRLAFKWSDGRRTDVADAEVEVLESGGSIPAAELVSTGGAPFLVDRMRMRHARPWTWALGVSR
jgi:hypothetical protein